MKIDFHCHTKAIKTGDGSGRNVTPELFRNKILAADIKIVAITNHNSFDLKQFNDLSEIVSDSCMVWPGVEIDVKDANSNRWHLIVIVNPKEAEQFSVNVKELFADEDLDTCTHTLEEIWAAFRDRDSLYIAHFHQKRPAISDEDAEKLEQLIGEPHRFFRETSNENSMSVFANYNYNVLVGSDVKNWNEYEKCSFAELKLPVDSFEQFCLLSKRDASVVQTLLNKKASKSIIAHPADNVDLPLRVYADINVIFGQKGTGKTEIIKSLCDGMRATGLNCLRYVASEREDEFKKLLSTSSLEIDLKAMGMPSCEEDFLTINEWSDSNPSSFSNYLEWKSTEGNNKNKARMKITRALSLNRSLNGKEEQHKQDKEIVKQIFEEIKSIELSEYLTETEKEDLFLLLQKLYYSISEKRETDLIEEEACNLTNYSIDLIKEIADKSTNSVSKPSTTGFTSFVERRLSLAKSIKNILQTFDHEPMEDIERIGVLDDKGPIFVKSRFRILSPESKTNEFKLGINVLKKAKTSLEELNNSVFDYDISEKLIEFNTICSENGISSIEPFVGRAKVVINSEGQPYKPSNGEKGMLLLQRALSKDADAYFLDEPELGMGNSYIDGTIRPIIVDLANRHKYVVVATHNSNIGVRTLPYTSVYRTHSNGEYNTYIGNPFSDKLVNINNENDVLNWAEESLKSLEGSKDAFYERKTIYESSNS